MRTKAAEPSTVGEVLSEEFLKPLGMPVHALEDLMGVTDKRVEVILMNTQELNKKEGLLLGKIFRTDNKFWIRLQRLHLKLKLD